MINALATIIVGYLSVIGIIMALFFIGALLVAIFTSFFSSSDEAKKKNKEKSKK